MRTVRIVMAAIMGGETHRINPLIDSYRAAGEKAAHAPGKLKVGLHSLGYVAETTQQAVADCYPGYAQTFARIGRERGWPTVNLSSFNTQNGPLGALVVGSPEVVAAKILGHSEDLGCISRFSFQMDNAGLSHDKRMHAIELIGSKVAPIVKMQSSISWRSEDPAKSTALVALEQKAEQIVTKPK